MNIKNTTIVYAGYKYQTLQGIKLLIEWLDSPNRYTRMAFEAGNNNNETPKGIDDIVGERPDGTMDYWQVKFTPSPEKEDNQLTWDWLLERKGKTKRSRSLLKKLSDAIFHVPKLRLGNVVLITNKLPDRLIEDCVKNGKVDFTRIDPLTEQKIIDQLGSDSKATKLFSILKIQHSDLSYPALKRHIKSELKTHSSNAGIDRLLDQSQDWVIFKGIPSKDGWIDLCKIREILSSKRPIQIPETFPVPKEYCLPNNRFHEDILSKILLNQKKSLH